MVLTSSRARADETVDELSDYDLIVAVANADSFVRDEPWLEAYPRPLARWGDEHEVLGLRTNFRGVVYEDGTKIDFTIWPDELLRRVAEEDPLPEDLDVGYRVLLDKDGRTAEWKPATYRAHIPRVPTAEEYRALVEEFWWNSTYVAKALRRGEIVFAKLLLDYYMKVDVLWRFLEWKVEIARDWNVRPGVLGRGLEWLLPSDVVDALHATYVGTEVKENWDALFRTARLFRRIATEVGAALGYEYPEDVDSGVTAHLRAVHGQS
jgi:aminoglycoside 6-adenylyltransferase